jgi:hypothetical protein
LLALKREDTNYKKQSIGITVIAVAIASLLIAGTILAPTQASAISQRSVSVNLEHRDQHMNQENLCYRANTCRQSNAGQNTLGNDNQVTGFADQSDNIQKAAAPTPVNQTTGNNTTPIPTPTPTPIPSACPAGTIFDVTLRVAFGNLPTGTVLCLTTAGFNSNLVAILPNGGGTVTVPDITAVSMPAGGCPSGTVAAAVTSGVLPSPLSGTTICVGT